VTRASRSVVSVRAGVGAIRIDEQFLVSTGDVARSSLREGLAEVDKADSCFEAREGEAAVLEMSGATATSDLLLFDVFA
jgi:hypothetical protein